MLKWAEESHADILSAALSQLTLGRAALYAAVLSSDSPSSFGVGVSLLRSEGILRGKRCL